MAVHICILPYKYEYQLQMAYDKTIGKGGKPLIMHFYIIFFSYDKAKADSPSASSC